MQVLKTKSSEGFVIKDFKPRDFKTLLFYYYYYFKIFDVKDFKSRDFETLLVF